MMTLGYFRINMDIANLMTGDISFLKFDMRVWGPLSRAPTLRNDTPYDELWQWSCIMFQNRYINVSLYFKV